MAIQIGSYNFDGPFGSTGDLQKRSGVYAVLGRNADAERWNVVDFGEAGDVQDRVSNHDRSDCWKRRGYRMPLNAAAYYCDERARMRIEQELRAQFKPPCGDR